MRLLSRNEGARKHSILCYSMKRYWKTLLQCVCVCVCVSVCVCACVCVCVPCLCPSCRECILVVGWLRGVVRCLVVHGVCSSRGALGRLRVSRVGGLCPAVGLTLAHIVCLWVRQWWSPSGTMGGGYGVASSNFSVPVVRDSGDAKVGGSVCLFSSAL